MKPTKLNTHIGNIAQLKNPLIGKNNEILNSLIPILHRDVVLLPGDAVEITMPPTIIKSTPPYTGQVNLIEVRKLNSQKKISFFWSDFIRYFAMVQITATNPEPIVTDHLANKLAKIAPQGYYVELHLDINGNPYPLSHTVVICINADGENLYIPGKHSGWRKLNWKSGPTIKKLADQNDPLLKHKTSVFYDFFPTYQALLNSNYTLPELIVDRKAPNDDFSP